MGISARLRTRKKARCLCDTEPSWRKQFALRECHVSNRYAGILPGWNVLGLRSLSLGQSLPPKAIPSCIRWSRFDRCWVNIRKLLLASLGVTCVFGVNRRFRFRMVREKSRFRKTRCAEPRDYFTDLEKTLPCLTRKSNEFSFTFVLM